jgi:tetratricopeptide (TPR) repeat protein
MASILSDNALAALLAGCLLTAPAAGSELKESHMLETRLPEPGGTDDPAYTLYREGYQSILQERWGAARELFAQLHQRYPESRYHDDAEYWTAFSWRLENPGRAREAYKKLIRRRPPSPYFGDAVADLRMLEMEAALANVSPPPPSTSHLGQELRIRIPEELRRIERDMAQLANTQSLMPPRGLMVIREGDTLFVKDPSAPVRMHITGSGVDDDAELAIRIRALDAIVSGKHDDSTFTILRNLAVDPKQPVPVRHVALNSLAGFFQKDPGSVFLFVANRDTNETVQRIAIELFATSNRSRADRTEHLIAMFKRFENSKPGHGGALSTTLYALAAIGDDRATDFLARIARSNTNQTLRNDAVYYLGNIGTDRARQVLLKIVRGE